jgi:two-component system cell cycle sensor histidine kinase/response regulator CckA
MAGKQARRIVKQGTPKEVSPLQARIAELEQQLARYRTFLQLTSEGIWRYESERPIPIDLPIEEQIEWMLRYGYLAECNPAYARMYGFERPEEIIGTRPTDRLVIGHPMNEVVLRLFVQNGYRFENVETVERDRDGNERRFLNSAVGVVVDGHLVQVWGVQTDITELRRLQEELAAAQRLESVGRLAGGVAHDFNNLLTAIMGYAELALERTHDERVHRYLEGVIQASERAADLVRQLLAYARRQIRHPVPINISQWLAEMGEMVRRLLPENVHLLLDIEPEVGTLHADPDQMTQVLLNLVTNARDAMPYGGTLTLRLYQQDECPCHAESSSLPVGQPRIILEVIDTGTGIAPEILPQIFEPFFTTKPVGRGTGLGLAAVHGIIQQMGGHIHVQSELGKGTRFVVCLPLATLTCPR